MLYLDNASSTKILDEVLEVMIDVLKNNYANSNSKYYKKAIEANNVINKCREDIAKQLNCKYDEVIFTSGATESNNTILKGLNTGIITTTIEHSSVLNTCKYLEKKNKVVKYTNVLENGLIDLEDFNNKIDENIKLASIILVNNEIGVLQDLKSIDEICLKHNIELHIDATAGIGKVLIDMNEYKSLKYITFSAHKIYGPKGIGVCIIKKDKDGLKKKLTPLLHGGISDEFGYRAGTKPTHLIAGLNKAFNIAYERIDENNKSLEELEEYFINLLKEIFSDNISINNDFKNRVKGIISVAFKGLNANLIVKKISSIISCSTGSACSNTSPSHVIKAINKNPKETIRFSLSPYLKKQDLDILKKLK